MIPETTLIALACFAGPNDARIDSLHLEPEEIAVIEQTWQSGDCLPDTLEVLLRTTAEKIKLGEKTILLSGGSPSTATLRD